MCRKVWLSSEIESRESEYYPGLPLRPSKNPLAGFFAVETEAARYQSDRDHRAQGHEDSRQ